MPGSVASTRGSRRASSSTTRSRARSIATPSSARARRGGTMISLGLQAVQRDHRRPTTRPTSGTSTRSTSPTATTGAWTTRCRACSCSSRSCCRASNMFCYGQVESPYGSGQFIKDLREHFEERRPRHHQRDPRPRRHRRLHQGLPGQGQVDDAEVRAQHRARRSYLRDEQEHDRGARRGLRPRLLPHLFEMLDYDQMNEIAAYGGFPSRYPHWRFGMEYEQLSKSAEYGLSTHLRDGHQQQPVVSPTCSRATA